MSNLDFIIGLPPDLPMESTIGNKTNTVMRNSMPIAKIYPGIPSFQKGLDLFTRSSAFYGGKTAYSTKLKDHGFTLGGLHNGFLQIAYLADSFPTDSFTNEYGENFLQKFIQGRPGIDTWNGA